MTNRSLGNDVLSRIHNACHGKSYEDGGLDDSDFKDITAALGIALKDPRRYMSKALYRITTPTTKPVAAQKPTSTYLSPPVSSYRSQIIDALVNRASIQVNKFLAGKLDPDYIVFQYSSTDAESPELPVHHSLSGGDDIAIESVAKDVLDRLNKSFSSLVFKSIRDNGNVRVSAEKSAVAKPAAKPVTKPVAKPVAKPVVVPAKRRKFKLKRREDI